jgi:hypothetical protein
MHRARGLLIVGGLGLGLFLLSKNSAGAGAGGVPTIPNTNSTFDARTWGDAQGPMIGIGNPLGTSQDARRWAVLSRAAGRPDRPYGSFGG